MRRGLRLQRHQQHPERGRRQRRAGRLFQHSRGNGGDALTGGTGRRNLLIAGGSAGTLNGGDGSDILIAGTTSYDTDAASLQAIAAYWAGTDDFATRVANLTSGTGVPLLDATQVTGNGGGNTVNCNGATDLLFADANLDTLNCDPWDTLISV